MSITCRLCSEVFLTDDGLRVCEELHGTEHMHEDCESRPIEPGDVVVCMPDGSLHIRRRMFFNQMSGEEYLTVKFTPFERSNVE